ncbi:hypothetical protein M1V99_17355 [Enterobacter bugandensis]|uniref:hypothetical protein n=1 Tax=Enterobacter bugandensis TaxID=881260 RepID=UPI002019DD21|nr:hypothetical protein [Enterobacter bugandensis]UQQ29899.1 hypothetical protein M1V99_17355 [Enterobacter bugandensis]
MKQRDIPQGETMTDEALEQWAQAFGFVALSRHALPRSPVSPGSLVSGRAVAESKKPMVPGR